jgi:starch-binding outer membrane protein, SusD/RagB family
MKQFIIYTYIGISLLTAAACKKQLEKLPENQLVDGNSILDQKTAEIALNGVYYNFAAVSVNNSNTTSWMEHEIPPAMFAGYLSYGFDVDPGQENNYANSSYNDIYWTSAYKIINAANGVIKGVSALPDSKFAGNRKASILGEAYFLRAYGHFKLLSFYGQWWDLSSPLGALIRDEFTTLTNVSKARSTVAESYDFILHDLNMAIANGPDTNPDYYATRWTAMALKMRVLMSHGLQADYDTVMQLADSITLSGKYTLEAKTQDIFYNKGLASTEVMLGVKPQPNQAIYYYNLTTQYYPGHSGLYVATDGLNQLLANDPRQSWLIGSANAGLAGTYYFLKYIAAGNDPTDVSETAYAFRLSEVYLLKAEAIIRSGGNLADAKTILKTVMGHGGVTDFSAVDNAASADELLLQSYYETVRNLIAEDGQEWIALLRLPFATVQQLKPTITDKIQYILPIPHSEFQNNPAIGDQNPGYSK